jgi:hypothetical protein
MTARRLLSLGIASCTVAVATPALAQPEMTYEPGNYQYARPAPVQEPIAPPVIFKEQPVVQPVPQGYVEDSDHAVEEVMTHAPHHGYPMPAPHHAQGHHQPAYPHHAYPQQVSYPPMPPQQAFDREAWLDRCRAQYRDDSNGRRDGRIGGGLLGAAVGGVIGNRVADGDRLAGTLIGAGVGGIAGAVLGSVIGGSGDRRRDARALDECEAWLDRYMAGGFQQGQHGYPGYGYGYGYAMHMTYVPVLVQIPQRAVVRETVTEEWVEVQQQHHHTHTYTRPAKKVHYHSAPAPTPVKGKTRYVKQR